MSAILKRGYSTRRDLALADQQQHKIRIMNAALDDWEGDLVLRGTIDPAGLRYLQIAEYQRERLSQGKIEMLKDAHKNGERVPDVDLSHRGLDYVEEDGEFFLVGETFVVDGQQRILSAAELIEEDPEAKEPHIGAVIHFGKDEAWERKRFGVLNLTQTPVSSNVTLRNQRHDLAVAQVMYYLATGDTKFVLCGKVTYSQAPRKGELISAVMLFKTVGMLHSHIGPGRATNVVELTKGLEQILSVTGRNTFINNVRLFFDIIDAAWGVQRVAYRRSAVHLKQGFLLALAKLFSSHTDFWVGESLRVSETYIKKLTKFPLDDPSVTLLASSSGKATDGLLFMLVEHLETPSKKLKRREGYSPAATSFEEEEA